MGLVADIFKIRNSSKEASSNITNQTKQGVGAEEQLFKQFEELMTKLASGSVSSTRSYNYSPSLIDGYNPNTFIQKSGSSFNTIDDMLNDEAIFAILELKKQFVLSTGYKFSGPDDQVSFLKENINNFYSGLFQEDLYQIQSAYEYGFSLSEKIFQVVDSKIYLKRLKAVPPHSIDYFTDDMGKLIKIVQRQPKNNEQPLPIDKMLIFVNIPKFDNPYGTSDLQRCYRAWLAKQMTIKFWNIYLQRFASPFPVAKVEDTFGATLVNKMISLLDSIQQTVSIVVPKSADLELFKVGDSSGEYDRAIERYNQMIARALLLPDLVGFGQTTQGGSYSLGEQQFNLFKKVSDFNRLRMTELLNEKVFKPLILANFGQQKVYAKFQFQPYEDTQINKTMESFYMAIDKGMPTILDDWNHIRDQLKFSNIKEQDLKEQDLKEQNIKEQGIENKNIKDRDTGDADASISSSDEPGESSNPTVKNPPHSFTEYTRFSSGKLLDSEQEIKFNRELNKYESRVSFIAPMKVLEDNISNTVFRASEKLKDCREFLKDFISRRDILSLSKFDEVEKLKLKYMGDLRIIFQRDFTEAYLYGKDTARRDVKELKFASLTDPYLPDDEVEEMSKELLNQWAFLAVGKLNDKLLSGVKQILLDALEKGKNYNIVASEINDLFNDVTRGASSAGKALTPAQLEAIARTSYMNAYNLGRKQAYISDKFVEMLQFSSVLDSRTCFVGDTLIITKEGCKKIKDICVGDEVLSHTGKYNLVTKTHRNAYKGMIIKVKCNDKEVICNEGHLFLTKDNVFKAARDLTKKDVVLCVL